MALALVERGCRLVTNDRLLVRPAGNRVEMVGVPKMPRVNPGTLLSLAGLRDVLAPGERARYSRLDPAELWALEAKHDVDVEARYGRGTFCLAGVLEVVYLLGWGPAAEGWQVRPLAFDERRAALHRVAKTVGVFDLAPPPLEQQQALLDTAAGHLAAYEVTGRADVPRLAEHILRPSG